VATVCVHREGSVEGSVDIRETGVGNLIAVRGPGRRKINRGLVEILVSLVLSGLIVKMCESRALSLTNAILPLLPGKAASAGRDLAVTTTQAAGTIAAINTDNLKTFEVAIISHTPRRPSVRITYVTI
jgi:hypothetical protein